MRLLMVNVSPWELTLMDQPIRPPREGGFKVLQTLEALAEDLRMPYLYPCLRHLERSGELPNGIVLFATDQGERRPSEADTIYLARAIRRLITYHFDIPEEAIDLQVFRDNPNDFGATFDYYRQAISQIKEASRYYVVLTPAPAPMESALLIHALLTFGDRLWAIYAGKSGDSHGAHPLHLGARHDVSHR